MAMEAVGEKTAEAVREYVCPLCGSERYRAVGVLMKSDKQICECEACDAVVIARIPQA
jgi:hypothetical protein